MSILTDLRKATKGLLFLSESDVPLQAFAWKGITIDSAATLLKHLKKDVATPVKEVPLVAFFAPMTTPRSGDDDAAKADQARFSALVARLSALTNCRVFRLGNGPEIDVYVVGQTPDGSAAGVRTKLTET